MSNRQLWCRIGDGGDYASFGDDFQALAESLTESSVVLPLSWQPGGFTCRGYRGNNYVSLYWSVDGQGIDAELSADDRKKVEQELKALRNAKRAEEYQEAVTDHCKGIEHISPGIASICDDCRRTWGMTEQELDAAYSRGKVNDEGGFGRSPCDTCGQSLAGNRYAAHGFDAETKQLYHLDVCEDCLCYFANGDLPDAWE
jgi:hypothetical protein